MRIAAVAALVLATSCAAGPISATPAGSRSDLPPPLPALADVDAVLAAIDRMPDQVGGAARVAGSEGEARYKSGGEEFGVEVGEIEDAYGAGVTVDQAIGFVSNDLDDPVDCSEANTWCLSGTSDGSAVVAWGSRDGGLMFAAVAPDQELLGELLAAWSGVVG